MISPWDADRADMRAATVAKAIVDVNTTSRGRRPKLTDFMPYRVDTKKMPTDAELRNKFRSIAAGHIKKDTP